MPLTQYLGVDVADLVGQEGLDAGALGDAFQPLQLLEVLTQLVRRHLRSSLSLSLSPSLVPSRW
jgi:hypothetical protein